MPPWADEIGTDEENESWILQRIIKIATHEIGHMYFLQHCIFYQCLMQGTNGLEQTDRNPITFCPICYRKLWKCTEFDHVERYKRLIECSANYGLAFNQPQKYEKDKKSVT